MGESYHDKVACLHSAFMINSAIIFAILEFLKKNPNFHVGHHCAGLFMFRGDWGTCVLFKKRFSVLIMMVRSHKSPGFPSDPNVLLHVKLNLSFIFTTSKWWVYFKTLWTQFVRSKKKSWTRIIRGWLYSLVNEDFRLKLPTQPYQLLGLPKKCVTTSNPWPLIFQSRFVL